MCHVFFFTCVSLSNSQSRRLAEKLGTLSSKGEPTQAPVRGSRACNGCGGIPAGDIFRNTSSYLSGSRFVGLAVHVSSDAAHHRPVWTLAYPVVYVCSGWCPHTTSVPSCVLAGTYSSFFLVSTYISTNFDQRQPPQLLCEGQTSNITILVIPRRHLLPPTKICTVLSFSCRASPPLASYRGGVDKDHVCRGRDPPAQTIAEPRSR